MSIAAGAIEAPSQGGQPVRLASVPVSVRTLTDREDFAAWDAYVSAAPDGSWFHTTAWMVAVQRAFGHQPIYLHARRGDRTVGVLPLFLVRSLVGGRMLVSVPYGVYGGVIADDGAARTALRDALMQQVSRLNSATVDLRTMHVGFEGLDLNDRYVTFRRELPDRPENVLNWLPRKARAAARKGRDKHRLTIEFGHHLLPLVWRLYGENMRRLASINYPYRFFELLIEQAPERTLTSVVYYEGRPAAGLLTLLLGDTVMPYFVGSDDRYRFASVSNFLYMALMEQAVARGYRVFDFGRSRRDNEGCCNFKRFHGFEATPLGYQRWVAPGAQPVDLSPTGAKFGLARRAWPYLPLAVTRPLGAWLAKHIPG